MDFWRIDSKENFGSWLLFLQKALVAYMFVLISQGVFRFVMFEIFRAPGKAAEYYSHLPSAMFLGARFDFAVANYILSVPLLLSFVFLWFRSKKMWFYYHKFVHFYMTAFLIFISVLFVWDITYYHYFTDHFNLLVFGLWEDDTVALLQGLWKNEPLFLELLGFLFFGYLIHKLMQKASSTNWLSLGTASFWKRALSYTISFFVVGLGARGSLNFDMHPLNRIHTEISPHHFVNQIAFSPVFALSDALRLGFKIRKTDYDIIKELGYSGNIAEAYKDLGGRDKFLSDEPSSVLRFKTPKQDLPLPHVVVFAMESMGSFWMKFDSDKFPLNGKMNKHFEQDVLNKNFLPSGNGTYASVTHWLLNLPALPGVAPAERFVGKEYSVSSLKPFKEAGYETHYMYGGGLGWRNLSGFLFDVGFDELHGETRIEESLGGNLEKHPWGVFDDALMNYVKLHLEKAKKPQLLFVLTTTNHPPFDVPKSYPKMNFEYPEELKLRLSKDSKTLDQRLVAYRFAMDSLADFMDWAKSGELDEPLLVAASGDHSFYESVAFFPEDLIEWRGVPFYLYSSQHKLNKKDLESKYGSHANIFPTLYDLSLSEQEYISLSKSFLRDGPHFALSSFGYVDKNWNLVNGKSYYRQDEGKYNLREDQNAEVSSIQKLIRAYYSVAEDLIRKSPAKKSSR